MKALAILNHSWSPLQSLICWYGTNEILWVSVQPSGAFSWQKLPPDYPSKSHDHDHQWTDLVMAWLPYDKRNCEQEFERAWLFTFCSVRQWVHMALAVNRHYHDSSSISIIIIIIIIIILQHHYHHPTSSSSNIVIIILHSSS